MAAIGGDAETPLAASANTVLPHQLLHPLLAHADTLSTQCAPDARPAVSSAIGHIHGANLHHQCFRAQVPTPSDLQATNKVLMIASHAYPEHPALHADRPHTPMTSNQGVLHFCPLAKYAIERKVFSQDVALHGHPRQLGSQAADLHLLGGHLRPALGTLQRAFAMSLDPVEQRLLYQTQRSRCRRYTLARLHKPNRLLLELKRVPRSRRLRHLHPLR